MAYGYHYQDCFTTCGLTLHGIQSSATLPTYADIQRSSDIV